MNPSEPSQIQSPVLLIGAGGMLGRAWRGLLSRSRVAYDAPPVADFDLKRPATLAPASSGPWRTVINCAAWTDVDGAESREGEARALNADGVGALAQACRRSGATLVHYSTDYVFDGSAREPIPVDAPRRPLGAYGRTKASGEEAIESSGCRGVIVRTSWLYAPWGKNFVLTMRGLLRTRPLVRVVNDQRGRPTSAEHLALASAALLAQEAEGLWHLTDGGECSWFEFAREIAALTPGACPLEPCTTREFPRPAPRPGYSVLDISDAERLLGPMPHWTDNLAGVIAQLPDPAPASR
ncbi:MAG TPA: dTDP-4-dehydrorhamnose reductase [Phycisphaerales bacterium]|nr:dTDP-4-dehydrorhamnose reductase [Phycisphaerales bacterium]